MGNKSIATILSSLTLAASCGIAPSAYAHRPIVYGMLDIALENVDTDNGTTSTDAWKVESFASRLGVKGKEHLSKDFTAIYQYELEIEPEEDAVNDNNDSNFLKAREQFVGLKGNFGTVRLGRMDTPLKKSQGKIDLFKDHRGDLKYTLAGEERPGNQFNYTSPTFAESVTLGLALLQGEGANIDGKAGVEDSIGDAVSFSATFEQENLFLSVAYDDSMPYALKFASSISDDAYDTWQVAGKYTIEGLQLGAVVQGAESINNNQDISGFLVSAGYGVNGTLFKLQYADSEIESSAGTTLVENDSISLGVDKSYSKRTTVYAEFTQATETVSNVETETTLFGMGIRKKF